jgi:hypothetical protein
VHQHDTYADLVQDAYLFHESPRAGKVREYLPADFQYEYLALEKAYVRRRVFECGYDGGSIVSLLHDFDPSI